MPFTLKLPDYPLFRITDDDRRRILEHDTVDGRFVRLDSGFIVNMNHIVYIARE